MGSDFFVRIIFYFEGGVVAYFSHYCAIKILSNLFDLADIVYIIKIGFNELTKGRKSYRNNSIDFINLKKFNFPLNI